MNPSQALRQPRRFFEVSKPSPGGTWKMAVGSIVKPLEHNDRYNFMVVKSGGRMNVGDKTFFASVTLRPLNNKDQRKIEKELVCRAQEK